MSIQTRFNPARRLVPVLQAAALLTALSGCAAIRDPYVDVTDLDAATLTIDRKTSSVIQIYGFRDARNCKGTLNFNGSQLLAAGEQKVIKLKPNAEFSFAASVYEGAASCNLVVSFMPKSNAKYRATIDSDSKECQVSLVRVEGSTEVREPSFNQRTFTRPMLESGSFCRPAQ